MRTTKLLLNNLGVESDGDRFIESVRICEFLYEIANSHGFDELVAIGVDTQIVEQ